MPRHGRGVRGGAARRRALLALCLLAAASGCAGASPRPAGAVLIVLDTLRADRLSAYGNPRPTTPHLDALAARGVLFEQVVSYTAWTLPSMAAMLSARYPTAAVYDGQLRASLVETLRAAGFETAALTEGGFLSRFFGMDLGFGFFHEGEGPVKLVASQVRSVDVLPTLLERLGVAPPEGLDGRSLVPLMEGEEAGRPPVAPDAPPAELYDLRADPAERANLAAEPPAALAELEAALREARSASEGSAVFRLDLEAGSPLEERLQALGHVD